MHLSMLLAFKLCTVDCIMNNKERPGMKYIIFYYKTKYSADIYVHKYNS